MCRCVSRMWIRVTPGSTVPPRRRIPVPASSTSSAWLRPLTSTQEVFPPYRTVSGPALGSDPLVPQRVILIAR